MSVLWAWRRHQLLQGIPSQHVYWWSHKIIQLWEGLKVFVAGQYLQKRPVCHFFVYLKALFYHRELRKFNKATQETFTIVVPAFSPNIPQSVCKSDWKTPFFKNPNELRVVCNAMILYYKYFSLLVKIMWKLLSCSYSKSPQDDAILYKTEIETWLRASEPEVNEVRLACCHLKWTNLCHDEFSEDRIHEWNIALLY